MGLATSSSSLMLSELDSFLSSVSFCCLSGGGWRRGGEEGEQADEGEILPENSSSLQPEKLAHFILLQLLQLHMISIISISRPAIMSMNHQERVPFAVVGSNTTIEGEGGKKSRGRNYFEFTNHHYVITTILPLCNLRSQISLGSR